MKQQRRNVHDQNQQPPMAEPVVPVLLIAPNTLIAGSMLGILQGINVLPTLLDSFNKLTEQPPQASIVILDLTAYHYRYHELFSRLESRMPQSIFIGLFDLDSERYCSSVLESGAHLLVNIDRAATELPQAVRLSQDYLAHILNDIRPLSNSNSQTVFEDKEGKILVKMFEDVKNMKINRRRFLQGTALTTAAVGVAAANPTGFAFKALAETDEAAVAKAGEDTISSCMCTASCTSSCRVMVHSRGGRIVKCEVGEQPNPKYTRICVRGVAQVNQVNSPHRLKYPMKRVGERGEGKWERITWDEALDTIAQKLTETREKYGPRSVIIANSGGFTDFLTVFLGLRLSGLLEASGYDACYDYSDTYGYGRIIGTNASYYQGNFADSIEDAKTIILLGSNVPETSPHHWRFFLNAKEKGAKLITIDPNYTVPAARADIHVRPRPGSDPALILSVCQQVVANDWIDRPFLLKYTVAPLLVRQDTKAYLRQSDLNGSIPAPGADDILVWDTSLGKAVLASETATPALSGSFTVNGIAVDTAYTLIVNNLENYQPEVTEKLTNVKPEVVTEVARLFACNKPSSMLVGNYQYDNGDVLGHAYGTLAALTGNLGKRGNAIGHLGHDNDYINPVPILFPNGFTKMTTTLPIIMVPEIVETGKFLGEDYPLKAMYLWGCNHLSQTTNQNGYKDSVMAKMDFIAVADTWQTDTTEMADIVLPAAHWFEQEGIAKADFMPMMAYTEKAAEPLFESRPDKDIIRDLGRRMGLEKEFAPSNEEFFTQMMSPAALADGIDFPTLKEKKIVWCKPFDWFPAKDWVGETSNFPTPTKRMDIYLEAPQPRYPYSADFKPDELHLPIWRPPFEAWPDNQLFTKYPLVALSERIRWRFHSGWHDNPWLRELDPEPTVKMNPADAAARGIVGGDTVEVFNDRGHFVLKAIINNGTQQGLISLPKGWQRYQCLDGSAQELTGNIINANHFGQAYFDVLCEVRKYKGGE